jgi:hypothetical protein
MPLNLTVDQVMAMAPDSGSAKSGKELSSPRKWANLGTNDVAAWGECQGSGSLPYQTRVDLSELVFKCSCPSRKFPCKHSLGLLLMLVEQASIFTQNAPPTWVTEWLDGRNTRAEKKAKKAEEGEKPVDAAAQAKRADQRKQKIAGGVAELDRWLQDVVRQGLAAIQDKPYSFWEGMAARLVDAQAPGLARQIRDCAGIASTGEGWQERLLARLGRLYLLVQAYERLDSLPQDLQDEIKQIVGFTFNQDELLKQHGLADRWEVVAQTVEQEDKLRVQRTWLYGPAHRKFALVLNFAHGTAPFDSGLVAGRALQAELVYYPGANPMRALVKSKADTSSPLEVFTAVDVATALEQYAQALSKNPWVERFPMALANVTVTYVDGEWRLVDGSNTTLPLAIADMAGWQMLSVGGGNPVNIFGEWDGARLSPLAVASDKCTVRVG